MRWRILQIRESCTKNNSMLPENIKHLEMIENVITRLSNIQTTLKGWLVTLLVAFMTLSKTLGGVHTPDKKIVISAILIFWYLDSTYLYKELMFRELFQLVDDAEQETARQASRNAQFSLALLDQSSRNLLALTSHVVPHRLETYSRHGEMNTLRRHPQAAILSGRL